MAQALIETSGSPREYQTELMDTAAFEKYWPLLSKELDNVPHVWAQWYTKEYLYAEAVSGQSQVWGVGPRDQIRLVVFTKVVIYPTAKVFQVFLALGNDLTACLPNLVAALEKAANDAGCARCEVIGRLGWEKLLPGFKRTSVILVRNLEHFKVQ